MFAYSLSGLQLQDGAAADVEIEENETTARSAVYQVLGRLLAAPDADHIDKARDGRWAKELAEAATLLPFAWEIGDERVAADVGLDDLTAEHARLFGAGAGGVDVASERAHADDAEGCLTELARSYQYFGLGVATDGVGLDSLATELDFMQYLAFKEAAAPSPRLGRSYQRAQLEFLDRHLGAWAPRFAEQVRGEGPSAFAGWAVGLLASFTEADRTYIRERAG